MHTLRHGKKGCVGYQLVEVEMAAIMKTLLMRFSLRHAPGADGSCVTRQAPALTELETKWEVRTCIRP
jgi:cytochrome P450